MHTNTNNNRNDLPSNSAYSYKDYLEARGMLNSTLEVTAGDQTFCLCEVHLFDFEHGVKRGENYFPSSIPGNWAKNTRFTTRVVDGVCPICVS